MSRRTALLLGIALLAVGVAFICLRRAAAPESVFEVASQPVQLAPMCPWRDPEADLKRLFPSASRYEKETRILSGFRTELAQHLGRMPTAEENALQIYNVFAEEKLVGRVTVRRVKGTFGAVELVIATDVQNRIAGVLVQRLREPPEIAEVIEAEAWHKRFEGKTAGRSWNREDLLAGLPANAKSCAETIVDGVHSALILLEASEHASAPAIAQTHKH